MTTTSFGLEVLNLLVLAHKIFTFLWFLNNLIDFLIKISGSILLSAILPLKIDIITGVFLFIDNFIFLNWVKVNTAVIFNFIFS